MFYFKQGSFHLTPPIHHLTYDPCLIQHMHFKQYIIKTHRMKAFCVFTSKTSVSLTISSEKGLVLMIFLFGPNSSVSPTLNIFPQQVLLYRELCKLLTCNTVSNMYSLPHCFNRQSWNNNRLKELFSWNVCLFFVECYAAFCPWKGFFF